MHVFAISNLALDFNHLANYLVGYVACNWTEGEGGQICKI